MIGIGLVAAGCGANDSGGALDSAERLYAAVGARAAGASAYVTDAKVDMDGGDSVFLAIFLFALVMQSLTGWQDFNNSQLRHHGEEVGYGRYRLSSEFGVAMLDGDPRRLPPPARLARVEARRRRARAHRRDRLARRGLSQGLPEPLRYPDKAL